MTNKEKANLYFWPELGGKCKENWCLHHKDPSWKKEDPVRYKQWNIEDLEPMTIKDHQILHQNLPEIKKKKSEFFRGNSWNRGRRWTMSEEQKRRISEGRQGIIFSEDHKLHLSESHIGQNAWNKGMPTADEVKRKQSAAKQGYVWWNNGEKSSLCRDCPR